MTINQETLRGDWNRIKGQVHQRWGQVSDKELEEARGNVDELIGLIQQRTGEAREDVETFLADIADEGASAVSRAAEAVRSGVEQVTDTAQRVKERTTEAAESGYRQTENVIRQRPMESLAVCFGAGLITGVVVGLLVRCKSAGNTR